LRPKLILVYKSTLEPSYMSYPNPGEGEYFGRRIDDKSLVLVIRAMPLRYSSRVRTIVTSS
jgi:hypothetical protein